MASSMKKLLKDNYTDNEYHTHISMITPKGKLQFNRTSLEELYTLLGENVLSSSSFLSGIGEKPQNYSMLRADIDTKEETTKDTPYELYSIFDAINLIKSIQEYLRENINGFQNKHLDCALLTKTPYLLTNDKGITYNKHGYHLQFINCFISKEDNKRLAEHFHKLDSKYDKVYNHPWLMYGCQKKRESGRYEVKSVILHDGSCAKPEEYFSKYDIFDESEKKIQYSKPIQYYYPRIFSIISYNRETVDCKAEINNYTEQSKKIDYFQLQQNQEDAEKYGDEIKTIISKFITNTLEDSVEICEATDRGFKLKRLKTFPCLFGDRKEHSRLGAYISLYDGGIYYGCYKCGREDGKKGSMFIGRYKESSFEKSSAKGVKLNFQEILSIPTKSRTTEQNDYLKIIFEKITKSNIDYLFNVKGDGYDIDQKYEPEHDGKGYRGMTYRTITKIDRSFAEWCSKQNMRHSLLFKNCLNESQQDNCRVEITDDGYVNKEILESKEKCIIVRAGLGKGKTQATTTHLNETDYDRIVILTPRKSFARCSFFRMKRECPKYPWVLYLKEKKQLLKHPFIICQAESLFRLDNFVEGKTLVCIDEIEAFLSQLNSPFHKENHLNNIETFLYLLHSADKIICLDAFISQRTLGLMKSLKIPFKFYDYTHPVNDRKCLKVDCMEDLLNRVNTDLLEDKKIYFFCSSIKKLERVILPTLQQAFPNKKILVYNSQKKSELESLSNCNEIWSKADVVLTTSSITVGCNFDLKDYFHKIYCYACATSRNYVRDMFQSMYRVRHLIEDMLVYFIDPSKQGLSLDEYPTNKKDIELSLKSKIELFEDQYQRHTKMVFTNTTPEWLSDLIVYNSFEYNVGIQNLEELFNRYLRECNYKHIDETTEDILIHIEFEEFTKPEIPYKDIPEMTSSQMKEMRKKRITETQTDLENSMWEKFWFQHCVLELPEDVENTMWNIYCDFGKAKFHNLCVEKGFEEKTVSLQDMMKDSNYSALNDGFNLRLEMIDNIKNWLGLKNTQQFGKKITREQLQSVLKTFEENKDKIHTVFHLRKDRSSKFDIQTCQSLIKKVFEKWGYSSLSKDMLSVHKPMINGKRVDMTPYIVQNKCDVDVYNYIKAYKSRKITSSVKDSDDNDEHQTNNPNLPPL